MNFLYFALAFFSLFFCGTHNSIVAVQDTGTLIVSYQTGSKGERLNRVRFLLSSEFGEDQIYPKGNAFVEDEDYPSRMVAIEDLPVGKYVIKFLVPNKDGLFEDVPYRTIKITKNSVIKIDQSIHPRYATVKAMGAAIPEHIELKKAPVISLQDKNGQIRAQSNAGKLVAHSLEPGNYTLVFEHLTGYRSPEPIAITLTADQISGPIIGNYILENIEVTIPEQIAQSLIHYPVPGRSNIIINQVSAQLTVNTNVPNAKWTLMRRGAVVYVGVGPVVNLRVPEGDQYNIVPEEREGFGVRVSPFGTFNLYASQTTRVHILYERLMGSVSLQASFPEGESLSLKLTPFDKRPPININVKSKGGKVNWTSSLLPTGKYEISYTLPPSYEPVVPETFIIMPHEVTKLNPVLIKGATLRVTANVPEAIFLLRAAKDSQAWKGEGREYSFQGLPPGAYQLFFETQNPDFFTPPSEMKIYLKDMESKEVNVVFELKGKLVINTNVERSQVTIQALGGKKGSFQEQIVGHTKTFNLPEGKYRVAMSPLQGNTAETLKYITPETVDVVLEPFSTAEVNLAFKVENIPPVEKQRKLSISLNISAGGYTVSGLTDSQEKAIGHYSGKSNQITLPEAEKYKIIFDDVPNYQTPNEIIVEVPLGALKTLQASYSSKSEMVLVPAGRAIIGDATSEEKINERPAKVVQISEFSIGTYEVTNEQFAAWLTEALRDGRLSYEADGEKRGQVLDTSGHLIFKTFEGEKNSQISAQPHSIEGTIFMPIGGKDIHPVIFVSWYGAEAFCRSMHCRLPTEAEWEKAAGMEPEKPGKPLKKFVYGFSRDNIDVTWANYKESINPIQHFQVLTTPVGFYNGMNYLPLTQKSHIQQQVQLAKSPYGSFDMSGNVWEWVADWYDPEYYKNSSDLDPQGPPSGTMKVVKGGCYDSLAEGVRVAERLGIPPDHTDAFTGFRIAVSGKEVGK